MTDQKEHPIAKILKESKKYKDYFVGVKDQSLIILSLYRTSHYLIENIFLVHHSAYDLRPTNIVRIGEDYLKIHKIKSKILRDSGFEWTWDNKGWIKPKLRYPKNWCNCKCCKFHR